MPGRLILLAFLLTLSGCVMPNHYNSSPRQFSKLPETHGVVVFQVTNMDYRLNRYMYDWHVFRTRRIGGGPMTWLEEGKEPPEKYMVYPNFAPIPGTTLWVGVLPAGNYLAEDLYSSFNNGNYYGHMTAPIADRFASFRVEPDRVTLLDTYLYKGFGNNFLQANVISPDDLLAAAREAYPEIMDSVSLENPLQFPTSLREDDAEANEGILKWAETVGTATYAAEGRVFRPARAGQIFERSPAGEWVRVSLPTFEPVEAVWATETGSVIAVTRSGRIFRRAAGNTGYAEIEVPLEGRVRRVGQDASGTWYVNTQTTRTEKEVIQYGKDRGKEKVIKHHELALWRSERLVSDDWEKVIELPVESGGARMTIVNDKAFLFDSEQPTRAIDLDTGSAIELEKSIVFTRAYSSGKVLGFTEFERGFWTTTATEIWLDDGTGNGWKQLPDVKPRGMPEMLSDGSILLVGQRESRTREEQARGDSAYEGFLQLTPGATRWKPYGEVPDGCTGWIELRELEDGILALCDYKVFFNPSETNDWLPEDMRDLEQDQETDTRTAGR